jgi:hypothetical protein
LVPEYGQKIYGKDEGRQIWWKSYVLMYENGKMRPIETILRKRREVRGE